MVGEALSRIEERAARLCEQAGIGALALGIVRGDELAYARGFGRDAGGNPVDESTLFPSCSTGKTLTGTALMRLVERGALALDRPVRDHLPWLVYPAPGDAARVSLRHLLSHTSGLSSDPTVPERLLEGEPDALEAHVRLDVPTYAAAGPPGELLWYSNPGFSIAGLLAQLVTGAPFASVVREHLLEPLGMRRTSFDPGFAGDSARAALPAPAAAARLPIAYPAGGALTCVADLARLAALHLGNGSFRDRRLLRAETVAEMQRPHADGRCGPPRRYGLAFTVDRDRGRTLIAHGGGGFGCGSSFVLDPRAGLGVIALFDHPAGYALGGADLLEELRGEPRVDPDPPRISPADGNRLAGTYRSSWPGSGVYPDRVRIAAQGVGMRIELPEGARDLEPRDDAVYAIAGGGGSVGFVSRDGSAASHLMLDLAGIGLVSAWPYRRSP